MSHLNPQFPVPSALCRGSDTSARRLHPSTPRSAARQHARNACVQSGPRVVNPGKAEFERCLAVTLFIRLLCRKVTYLQFVLCAAFLPYFF